MTDRSQTYEEYVDERYKAQNGIEDEEDENKPQLSLTSLVTGIVVVAITLMMGIYILGNLQDTLTAGPALNATSELSNTLSQNAAFFPILVDVAIIVVILSVVMGMFGISYHYQDEEDKIVKTENNPKPHRQTYLEYVKEQLAVERMLR